jgi:hypothetical protein
VSLEKPRAFLQEDCNNHAKGAKNSRFASPTRPINSKTAPGTMRLSTGMITALSGFYTTGQLSLRAGAIERSRHLPRSCSRTVLPGREHASNPFWCRSEGGDPNQAWAEVLALDRNISLLLQPAATVTRPTSIFLVALSCVMKGIYAEMPVVFPTVARGLQSTVGFL